MTVLATLLSSGCPTVTTDTQLPMGGTPTVVALLFHVFFYLFALLFQKGILLFPASFIAIPEFMGIHVRCCRSSLFPDKSRALALEEAPVESMMHYFQTATS